MRIALHAVGDAAQRAGRILLAESDLVALGLYGHGGSHVADRRTIAIRELTGFDILVTDDVDAASAFAGIALDDGLDCVVSAAAVDADLDQRYAAAARTLLVDSGSVSSIAACLASHEVARTDGVAAVTMAWTVPGKPLHRGQAIAFPDPVGGRWGRRVGRSPEQIEVPVEGEWAGASVTVLGRVAGESTRRVVGVADHRGHLEGIALAAGALAILAGGFGSGLHRPGDAPEAYLAAALRVGLGVAAITR